MSFLKLNWGIAGLLVMVFPSLGWAGQPVRGVRRGKSEQHVAGQEAGHGTRF